MMKSTLRTWGIAFIAAALMTGCGKDNSAGGAGDAINSGNGNFTGTTTASSTSDFQSFITEVEAGRFQGSSLGSTSAGREFYWRSGSAVQNNDNCKTKWGIFTYCNYSSSTSYNGSYLGYSARRVDVNGNIQRLNFGDLDTFGNTLQEVQNNLVARMRNATNIRKCVNYNGEICYYINSSDQTQQWYQWNLGSYPSTRYIFDHGGFTYLVDTTKPLAANPIGIMRTNSSDMRVFYGTN